MAVATPSDTTRGPVRRWLAGSYADLTDGQRWTMGLVVALVVVFVAGGLRQTPESNADIFGLAPAAANVGLLAAPPPAPIAPQPTMPAPPPVFAPVVAPPPPTTAAPSEPSTSTTSTTEPPTTTTTQPPVVTLPTLPGVGG